MHRKLAISSANAKSLEEAMEWILAHEDDAEMEPESSTTSCPVVEPVEATSSTEQTEVEAENTQDTQEAKSIRCDDCGTLFKDQTAVEYHAAKTGHGNFSESTEEKKPMTDEEKKEQLAKVEAKLKQRRLDREAREKLEALEREKNRIRSGKEMGEAKKKQEDLEIKKMLDQRRRDKEEEKMARQRVKDQIEQDKMMRKAKFSNNSLPEPVAPPQKPVVNSSLVS